jgi:simple sugar transport system substrate-binding protein
MSRDVKGVEMGDGQEAEDGRRRGINRRDLVVKGGVATAGALSVPALLGASYGSAGGTEKVDIRIVATTHAEPGHPFWAVYRKGLRDAARDFGVGRVRDLAPERYSIEKLVDLMNSAVAGKPDGIIATITDPAAVDRPLKLAISKGIPVVAINVNDPRPPARRIKYLTYVGGDEKLGGQRAAERQLQERTPKRAVCAIHLAGHIGLELRCRGYTEVMQKKGVRVDKLLVGEDPTKGAETLRAYFTRNKNADALFTVGSTAATPALQVLDEERLTDKVMHSTFDLDPVVVRGIKARKILSTIGQQQYLQGYLPVLILKLNLVHGFGLASDVLTGPFVIDQSNIRKVEEQIKKGFM